MNFKPGICTFCGTGCGHLLKVTNGQINGVFPSLNHPISKGKLCVRGWNIHEFLNSHARIKHPLIRKNNKLEKASYNEAIAFFTNNLLKYKNDTPSKIGFLASPRSSNEENFLFMKLARSIFKCNNISLISDTGHRNSLDVLYEGTAMAGMPGSLEEITEAEFILVVGMDITKLNPIIGSNIHLAVRHGATLVTIDSRKTQIAELSGKFLHVNPGTIKIALAALAITIIEERLINSEYIEKYTSGSKDYIDAVNKLDYAEAVKKTGCQAEEIKEIARKLAKARSGMAFFPSGISGFDKDTIGHIFNLFLITGKIGMEGCGINPITGINNLQGSYDMGIAPDLLTGFQKLGDKSVLNKFTKAWGDLDPEAGTPVYDMLYENNINKLKVLVVVDHDEGIIRGASNIEKTDFTAYIGSYENDFINYADVVLPVASYVECDGTYTNTERRVQLSVKKLDPRYGVLPAWKLYTMIAETAGMKWNYTGPSDVMKEITELTPAYSGITHEKLKDTFGIQWPCDDKHPDGTKRLNIKDVNEKFKFSALSGSYKTPSTGEEYPYLLVVGKSQDYWHKNNIMKHTFIPMREYNATLLLFPEGYVEISPENAKELKVRDNSPIRIISPYGAMQTTTMISGRVKPYSVYVPYFVHKMITEFLLEHKELIRSGESEIIPVKIVKV